MTKPQFTGKCTAYGRIARLREISRPALPSGALCLAAIVVVTACGDGGANESESDSGTGIDSSPSSTTGGDTSTATSTATGAESTSLTTEGGSGSEGEDGTGGSTSGGELLTYWDDVAPIYYDKCVACHGEGGAAGFRLDNFADASIWAPASAIAVQNRTMPPWLATADGSCGEFAHDRSLSAAQIDTIVAWAGARPHQEGIAREIPITPQEKLLNPTELLSPEYVPVPIGSDLAKWDDYRCFLVDPGIDREQFLTGYGFEPGNAALVHHVIMFGVDMEAPAEGGSTNAERIAALDAESPDQIGWPCFGLAGDGVNIETVPAVWAPGQADVVFPDDSGLHVTPRHKFVVQFHYNFPSPDHVGQSDQSSIFLQYEDQVSRLGTVMFDDGIIGSEVELPPGQAEVKVEWDMAYENTLFAAIGAPEVNIWGFMPHMHEYGTSQTLEMLRDDAEASCLTEVKHWDFDWQHYYLFADPVRYGPGDRVRTRCFYDTTSTTDPVLPGWGTDNEMCTAIYYATMEFPPGVAGEGDLSQSPNQ